MGSQDRVLVAGAGPVGLVAATYLAQHGVPVTLVEAEPELGRELRASTVHPPPLDMMEEFGIAGQIVEQGLKAPTWQFRDRRDGPVATTCHNTVLPVPRAEDAEAERALQLAFGREVTRRILTGELTKDSLGAASRAERQAFDFPSNQ